MRFLLVLGLLAAACSSSGPKGPPSLSERLPADRARAGKITSDDELIGGPTAVGTKGDFKLYNAKIAVIVEAPGPSDGYDTYGGLVVDADVIRAPGEKGHSRFGEAIPVYNFRTPRGVSAEVVNDGTDGLPAQVRVHAVDDTFPLVEAVLGQNRPDMHLAIDIDYVLAPGADHLRIVTTLKNQGNETVHVGDHYVGYVMGDGLKQFLTRAGFDIPQLPPPASYFAAVAPEVSYSFWSPDSEFAPVIQFQGFLLGALQKFQLEAGQSNSIEMDLVVGDGDLAKHEAVHRKLMAAAQLEVPEVHTVSGTVKDGQGVPVARARVHAVAANGKDYLLQTLTKADGSWSMALPPGKYGVSATADGRDPGAPANVDATSDAPNIPLEIGGTGVLQITVKSGDEAIPAKVMLTREGHPAPPPASFGDERGHMGYERVEFLPPGTQSLELPPGTWKVLVSRGFEYDTFTATAEVTAGATAKVDATLTHVVDTTGWLSGDYHVHAQWSPDSDDLVEQKALAFGAEGLEIPVSTEHEYIGDFQPVIARLGLSKWVHGIIGEEVSTTPIGHFNTFPLEQDPLAANFGALSWYGVKGDDLMKMMRARSTKPLVQVNHPRSGTFGSPIIKGYFTAVGFDPATFSVRADRDWSTDYDALEIANGATPDYEDWFPFLDRGMKMLGTGDSDSHIARNDIVGFPRNYVFTGTDSPENLDLPHYMDQLRAGRLTVSGGFFVLATVGDHQLGDLVPKSEIVGGQLPVQVKVQAPAWVPDGRLEIVVNGQVAATKELAKAESGPVRFSGTVPVDVPEGSDSWVFARVVSGAELDPVYPGAPAFGFANPIYVDGNASGAFEARIGR